MSTHEIDLNVPLPELEPPPAPEMPAAGIGSLFTDDSVATLSCKLMGAEHFLRLLTRDYAFQDFTREILVTIMKTVKSEAGSLLEVNYQNRTLFFRAIVGQSSDRLNRFVIPMGQGIVGYVAESKQPIVVNNVEENRRYLRSIQDAVGFEARNLVALPLVIRGKIYGVIELLNRVGEDNYTHADMELLNYLCEMASKAIEVRLMLSWALRSNAPKEVA